MMLKKKKKKEKEKKRNISYSAMVIHLFNQFLNSIKVIKKKYIYIYSYGDSFILLNFDLLNDLLKKKK